MLINQFEIGVTQFYTASIQGSFGPPTENAFNLNLSGPALVPDVNVLSDPPFDNATSTHFQLSLRLEQVAGGGALRSVFNGRVDSLGIGVDAPIPEPNAAILFGVGLLVAGAAMNRRHF